MGERESVRHLSREQEAPGTNEETECGDQGKVWDTVKT